MTPDEVRALADAIRDSGGPGLVTIIAAVASTASALLLSILAWLAKRQIDRLDRLEGKAQTKEACVQVHTTLREQLDREQRMRDDAAREATKEMTGALKLVDRALNLLGGGKKDP